MLTVGVKRSLGVIPNTFGNREALDWLSDLVEEGDPFFIHYTLEIIVDYPTQELPEAWDSLCALAAGEVVAAALGKPAVNFPGPGFDWLAGNELSVDAELLQLAVKAVSKVGADSLLKMEFEEDTLQHEFQTNVANLLTRLGR